MKRQNKKVYKRNCLYSYAFRMVANKFQNGLREVIDMTIDEIKRQMFIDSEEVCGNTMIDTYQAQEYVEQAYNKALDDIVTIIKERVGMDWEWAFCFIEQIAEQLKEGEENDGE